MNDIPVENLDCDMSDILLDSGLSCELYFCRIWIVK